MGPHPDAPAGAGIRPAIDNEALVAADLAHLIHPLTDHVRLRSTGPSIAVEGSGCELVMLDGQRLLDGLAGLWTVNLGYGREDLVEAAMSQMRALPYCSTFGGGSSAPAIELAERVAAMTLGSESGVFFTTSGSEANETAIKLARYYWHRTGHPNKKIVLAHERAYHGLVGSATAATGLAAYRRDFSPLDEHVAHVPPPYQYRCSAGVPCDAGSCPVCQGETLERRIEQIGAENIAALIVEPVMGAGGVIVPPAGYLSRLREICTRHEVLLITDEVITGFGRTGRWFGCERDDVTPDFLTFAKGVTSGYMPLGGTVVSAEIWEWLRRSTAELPFMHGFTHGGHPVACAVALACLDALEREDIVEHVRERGLHLASRLAELAELEEVGEVRSEGLVAGVELVADRETRMPFPAARRRSLQVVEAAQERGLRIRPLLDDILLLAPPLVISDEQLSFAVDVIAESITATR
jgi:putrescine---pyruvate transaminase